MEWKYGNALGVFTHACYQEFERMWDVNKIFGCVAVFTAGPNVSARGKDATSSMTRTMDPEAQNISHFKRGVKRRRSRPCSER